MSFVSQIPHYSLCCWRFCLLKFYQKLIYLFTNETKLPVKSFRLNMRHYVGRKQMKIKLNITCQQNFLIVHHFQPSCNFVKWCIFALFDHLYLGYIKWQMLISQLEQHFKKCLKCHFHHRNPLNNIIWDVMELTLVEIIMASL